MSSTNTNTHIYNEWATHWEISKIFKQCTFTIKDSRWKEFHYICKYQHLYRIDIQVYCYANYADLIGVLIFTGFTGRFGDPDGL